MTNDRGATKSVLASSAGNQDIQRAMDVMADLYNLFFRHHKACSKMERGLVPNTLVPRLRAAIDEYRALLPVVVAMRNTALKDRHWSKINGVVGTTFMRDNTFTLQVRMLGVELTQDP